MDRLVPLAAALAAALLPLPAPAQASGTLAVSLTVAPACAMSVGPGDGRRGSVAEIGSTCGSADAPCEIRVEAYGADGAAVEAIVVADPHGGAQIVARDPAALAGGTITIVAAF